MSRLLALVVLVGPWLGCAGSRRSAVPPAAAPAASAALRHPQERHLADIVQLTAGGENAEAYWSFDDRQLIFQTTRPPYACDQIMRMPSDGSAPPTLVSTGRGRTTCAYFLPGQQRVIFSSTHATDPACPPAPDRSQGYVWALYPGYDVYSATPDGGDLRNLTSSPGYDAEATVCPRDGTILFTSVRDGDLELYRMNADGSQVKRLTEAPGYDGGAFFSPDCRQIVWRASRPQGAELADYQALLARGLVRPTKLELWLARADGSEARQITYLDAASFAPYFHPSGRRILFSSNTGDPRGREFDLWAVDVDGSHLERITFAPGFDGFPMFSFDGTRLVFASNRNQKRPGDTDVYVARWIEGERPAAASAADRMAADVAWLADDRREGRGVGTRGLDDAARWLERQLRDIGAEPGGAGGLYRQSFDVPLAVTVGAATRLEIDGRSVARAEFVPASFSSPGEVSGDTVLAGHGIVAPELGRDDYARVTVAGKVVVVRRFTPDEPAFAEPSVQRRYSDLRYKAFLARERGARAVLVVDLPGAGAPAEEAALPALGVAPLGEVGIPVLVLRRAPSQLLGSGKHAVALTVALDRRTERAHNVIARIPAGAAERLPGAVVVGAHYDHLGRGALGSLESAAGAVHNGADDNASGTAALLEVARQLEARRASLRRDVYIIAFTAEEAGILGSSHFVSAPPAPLVMKEVVAMLNMDMIGRLRGNRLAVLGGDSAAEWPALVEPLCQAARLLCTLGGEGWGPSDQTPFHAAGVPVLHFFTGSHADYHRASDDSGLINAAGAAQIAQLVAATAEAVAARPARLTHRRGTPQLAMGDLRASGASLGTIPDYAASASGGPGVVLAGVRPGGPAERGGLLRGDRITAIDRTQIRTVEDLMYVLQQARPGQSAMVVVQRGGTTLELRVTFGPARARRTP